eukprot:904834-Rhodomonas_salina.2
MREEEQGGQECGPQGKEIRRHGPRLRRCGQSNAIFLVADFRGLCQKKVKIPAFDLGLNGSLAGGHVPLNSNKVNKVTATESLERLMLVNWSSRCSKKAGAVT